MPMLNPPHPGEGVKDIIEDMGRSVTDTAKALGVTRQALNNLVNCHSAVSPEMSIRLEAVFGSSADNWLRLQAAYDLAQVRKREVEIAGNLQRLAPV